MKNTLKNCFLFLVVSTVILCAGCASVSRSNPGSSNTQAQAPRVTVPAGKALIYVYENPYLASWANWSENIKANGELIGYMSNRHYVRIPYIASPGKIELLAGSSHLALNAEAGKTYYVRASFLAPGFLTSETPKLEWVRDETGASEIPNEYDCMQQTSH